MLQVFETLQRRLHECKGFHSQHLLWVASQTADVVVQFASSIQVSPRAPCTPVRPKINKTNENEKKSTLGDYMITWLHDYTTYACVCSGGNASKQNRDRLEKTIRKAGEVIGRQQETFDSVCHRRLTDRLNKNLSDDTHPLRPEFDSRLIDRSGRLRVLFTTSQAFIHSESHTDIQPGTWQTLSVTTSRHSLSHPFYWQCARALRVCVSM